MYNEYPQIEIANDLYMNDNVNGNSPYYARMSGTSMATPFVSATAALLMQQNPEITPDQVKARLMLTADKTTFPATSSYTDPSTGIIYKETYDIFTIGAGYLNVGNALFSTALAPPGVIERRFTRAGQDECGRLDFRLGGEHGMGQFDSMGIEHRLGIEHGMGQLDGVGIEHRLGQFAAGDRAPFGDRRPIVRMSSNRQTRSVGWRHLLTQAIIVRCDPTSCDLFS